MQLHAPDIGIAGMEHLLFNNAHSHFCTMMQYMRVTGLTMFKIVKNIVSLFCQIFQLSF